MKLKKMVISTILLAFIFTNLCYADVSAEIKPLRVNARSAIALDCETGRVLFEKNSKELIPMASTTKIMTALTAIKYGNLDKEVEISPKAASVRGSTVGYSKGEKVTLRELLYGLMLRSGNDAAIAIAEGVAGSIEGFSKLMNEYALELGLLNSQFQSPHGLDMDRHYCTAEDLAYLTIKARENPIFKEIVSCKSIEGKEKGFKRGYNNINKILWKIDNADGVKTGYTGGAGKCLVTSINHSGRGIVIVVLNCADRWEETEKIYKWVKDNYDVSTLIQKDKTVDSIIVKNKSIPLVLKEDLKIPIKINEEISTKIVHYNGKIKNVSENDILGRVEVYSGEKLIYWDYLYPKKVK